MYRCLINILATVTFSIPALAQQDTLHWNADRPVSWKDYKGSTMRLPDYTNSMAATHSGIRVDMKSADAYTYVLYVYAVFNRRLSCTKCDTSAYLLNHERNHFNITELCTLRLRKELLNTVLYSSTADAKITSIYNKYTRELNDLQETYDNETKHSMDKVQQAQWDVLIKLELIKLSDYASPQVVIHLKRL